MKYVISVSKTYKHRGNHRHKSAKKHWFVYWMDEKMDLHCDMVNFLQAWFYKLRKYKRIKFECPNCGKIWLCLARSRKDILKLECQNCGEEFGDWL